MPFVLDPYEERILGTKLEVSPYPFLKKGSGILAGTFPDGITTVDGVPVSATVIVRLRGAPGSMEDGALVAVVKSGADGTWSVTGLPADVEFDVIGRLAGKNDTIKAAVTAHIP